MEYLQLNNGFYIPKLGIGTYQLSSEDAENAVLTALQNGYRLIDTANAYMNEKAVGRAIKASGIPRKEIFLSTKLWPNVYKKTENAIDETLQRLNVDYVDLLFLHQPAGDYMHAYAEIEKAVKNGKVKSIGLSNFYEDQVLEICRHFEIKPAIIQLETHPYFDQHDYKNSIKEINSYIMAWYPLGHGDTKLINEEIFTNLANKYNKSNAQIILRWHLQMNHVVIPGSKNPTHIVDNINVFDFTLSDEEMREIAIIHKNKAYNNFPRSMMPALLLMRPNFNKQK